MMPSSPTRPRLAQNPAQAPVPPRASAKAPRSVPRWVQSILWTCALGAAGDWLSTIPSSVRAQETAPPQRAQAVLGVARDDANDAIELSDSSRILGRVVNSTFQIHTAHGSFPVETRFIAALVFNASAAHLDSLLTVNRNRLSGFVNEEIQLLAPSGATTNLSKQVVRRVIFRLRESENQDARNRRFVSLDNGDLLSGEFALPHVLIDGPGGARSLSGETMETLRFDRGSARVSVQFSNGNEDTGRVAQETLPLRLDCGPDILLPRARLKTLFLRSGFIPNEARQLFGAHGASLAPGRQPPQETAPPGFVWIPPGTFTVGSPAGEQGRGSDEDPQTEVTISRGFWIAAWEVTQGEFSALMGSNPSHFQGDTNRPVEKVSWHEAREYCERLSEQARRNGSLPNGYVYRMPTEAEWEYACRAGSTTRFSFGDDLHETALADYAWFIGNSDLSTHPVGTLKPNPWGLFDMHGNVWEWCLDLWAGSYPGGQLTDPRGPTEGWLRVARGGSWLYSGNFSRSANRDNYGPDNRCSDIGFRLVLAIPPP